MVRPLAELRPPWSDEQRALLERHAPSLGFDPQDAHRATAADTMAEWPPNRLARDDGAVIADGDDLERIAVEEHPDVPAMKGWRYEMFGRQAELLKCGELALKVEAGEVVTVSLPPARAKSNAALAK